MLFSNLDKRVCSGWLKKNQPNDFSSDLKIQKFLFFYEALAETESGDGKFASLKGYKNGPVYSDVYGDCTHERWEFSNNVDIVYKENPELVKEDTAKLAGFLVKIMSDEELSLLTHEFNIWRAKEDRIASGERQIPLSKDDFNQNDKDLMTSFREAYSSEYIDSVEVIKVLEKYFIIDRDELSKIKDQQKEAITMLANRADLVNPVYISVDEDGVIIVD